MTRPPVRVRGEWKMRGRFLVGAAAVFGLFGVVSVSGEASAQRTLQCSDFRNQARQSTDVAVVREWRQRASACSQGVRGDIDRHLASLVSPGTNEAKPGDADAGPVPPPGPMLPPTRAASARPLTLGQTVEGSLSATSARDPERGIAYEYWSLQAPAGQRLQISMTASQAANFDTYLEIGRIVEGRFDVLDYNDDRGDGTFNSRLRFTPEESGAYTIRARSFAREQYGAYSLLVEPFAQRTEAPARPLRVGQMREASLAPESSAVDLASGYSFDTWVFPAEAGQRLQVSMTSEQFDTYVVVGRLRDGAFEELASNDDRGDGTLNSMLRFAPAEAGDYAIRARSFGQEQFGAYQLVVQAMGAPSEARVPLAPRANAWVREGRVSSSPTGDFTDFEFQATRGTRYNVRVISSEFSPIVDIGREDGARLVEVNFLGGDTDRAWNNAGFTADRRGNYILRVSAPANTGGDFQLVIEEVR